MSIYLVYTVSLKDIESSVHDLSLLRVLGLQRSGVIGILLLRGLFLALPGFFIGLLISYHLEAILAQKVYTIVREAFLESSLFSNLISSDIVILGVLIPLIAAMLPARKALR
jgi:ABC-type antimicrobial peptide transport system permease subunit